MNTRPSRLALAAICLLAAAAWLLLNSAVEGPVLFGITYNHGVHTADLLSVVLVVVAGLSLWTGRRSSR